MPALLFCLGLALIAMTVDCIVWGWAIAEGSTVVAHFGEPVCILLQHFMAASAPASLGACCLLQGAVGSGLVAGKPELE